MVSLELQRMVEQMLGTPGSTEYEAARVILNDRPTLAEAVEAAGLTDDKSSSIERESNAGSVPITRTAEGMFFAARCRSGAPALGYPVARVQGRCFGRRDASVRTGSRLQQPRRQTLQRHLQKSRILRRIRNIGFSLGTLVQGLGLDDLRSFRG